MYLSFFYILITGIFLTLSIFHILIFFGRKNELSNLSFAVYNISNSLFSISIIFYKYFSIIDRKIYLIFLAISIIFLAVSSVFFIFTIFNISKLLKPIIIYNSFVIIISIFSIIFYLKNYNLIFISLLLLLCTIYAVLFLIFAGIIIIKTKQYKKNNFNKMISFGFCIMLFSYIILGILKSAFINLRLGTAMFIPSFILIFFFEYALITQFNALYNNLEQEVIKKTDIIKVMEEKRKIFFINFAHEIKTPLTLISNYIERAYNNIKNQYNNRNNNEQVIKDLDIARNNVSRIQRDVLNYLDSEKIERGYQIYQHDQIINFSKILSQKIKLFQQGITNKNLHLSYDIKDNLFIKIDTFAIERIMNNLLDNAIKYTKENGSIIISLKNNNKKIEFIIEDTGVGIDKKDIEYIFQPFTQLSKKKNQLQGMGLGLSIVKDICDNINAKIKVAGKLNRGSKFKIIFNKYIPKNTDIIQDDYSFLKESPVYPSISADNIRETEIYDEYNSVVFLVEDNLEMVSFLQENLMKKYNFYYSINGKKALEKLQHIPKPDIIISDIMMNEMNGYEFYENIKNHDSYNNIPFLFLTAKSGVDEKIKGLSKGAIDFITKPFILNEFQAKINSILKINKLKEKSIIESIYKESKKQYEKVNKSIINYNKVKEIYNLTNKEIEICKLIEENLSNKEIGVKLKKAESTIKNYIQIIFEKLCVNKREKLIDLLLTFKNIY